MEFMARYPDKYFELAIIDSPYGIGEDGSKNHTRSKMAIAKDYKPYESTDDISADEKYFIELFRVSKNQIIFGANHFISKFSKDSSCWVVWDKENGNSDFADCELAWTSFTSAVMIFRFRWSGMLQGDMKNKEFRIHPNQKPVALYRWLLKNYAKPSDKILDTHMGSQSSRIAAYDMDFDFYGCELDPYYFSAGCERFERFKAQLKLDFEAA
jgi:site-specific DNA-methyltransferase (adenine-specific)